MAHLCLPGEGTKRKPIRLLTREDAAALYQEIWENVTKGGDVRESLRPVAEAFGYEFDPVLENVLDLSLGELQQISRFGGNPNTSENRKGNTAQHVLQGTLVACYDIVDEFREFLFSPHLSGRRIWAEYTDEEIDYIVENVPSILDSVFLEYLSHDDGEKLFEPASLSQAVMQDMRKSWPVLERRIAHFGVALALYAQERFKDRANRKEFYGRVFNEIRVPAKDYFDRMTGEISAGRIDVASAADTITKHIIDNYIRPQEARYHLSIVAARHQSFIDRYMSRYDDPEGFGRAGGFTGIYTKVGQKNQSVMHLVEHQGRDGSPPHEYTTSLLTVASLGYAEAMLPRLFSEVEGNDPIQSRLARRAAIRVYETNLAMTKAMPAVIDVSKTRRPESDAGSLRRLDEIRQLASEICGGGRDADFAQIAGLSAINTPGTLRTAFQLRARYEAALQEAQTNKNYVPPAEPLYALQTITGPLATRIANVARPFPVLFPPPDEADIRGFLGSRWKVPVAAP